MRSTQHRAVDAALQAAHPQAANQMMALAPVRKTLHQNQTIASTRGAVLLDTYGVVVLIR